MLESAVREDTLILDIGAALGLWTVPLGRYARRAGAHVWAFEPHPNNLRWLRRNVEINGLADIVDVQEVALGDRAGKATMRIAEGGRGEVGNAFVTAEGDGDGTTVTVTALDDLDLPRPVSVMKIDVEGFEISRSRATRGTHQLLTERRMPSSSRTTVETSR